MTSLGESGLRRVTERISPADFAHHTSGGLWQYAPHLMYINEAIMELCFGDGGTLVICAPVRHGKSLFCSHYVPAWYLLNNPDRRVMFLTYADDYAKEYGRAVRDTVEERGAEWGVSVSRDSHSATRWNIANRQGKMYAVGLGGRITGRGADLLICDDLIKGSTMAMSRQQREAAWRLFSQDARTRLEPGGRILIVQTRWHEDDPAGRVMREMDAGVTDGRVITLRAQAEDDDPLGRQPGEALWPDRYPREYLEAYRRRSDHDEARMGPYWYESLFQQRITPIVGGIIKRDWLYRYSQLNGRYVVDRAPPTADERREEEIHKRDCWLFATCDLAISQNQAADYFVMGVWAMTKRRELLLIDIVRDRLEAPEQAAVIKRKAAEHDLRIVGIENVAYQRALGQLLRRDGLAIKDLPAIGDKVARAQPAAVRFQSGQIFLPRAAPWLSEYEAELLSFPGGKYNDQVDVTSMASEMVGKMRMPGVVVV